MLHFLNRFFVEVVGELVQPPIFAHFGADKILIDRGQLNGETGVECFDDLWIAFHKTATVQRKASERKSNPHRITYDNET